MTELKALGLGRTMESKLRSVGINSAEELRAIGSREAVWRLKEQYPGTCAVILYYLEAVLCGVTVKELAPAKKAELKAYFKRIS